MAGLPGEYLANYKTCVFFSTLPAPSANVFRPLHTLRAISTSTEAYSSRKTARSGSILSIDILPPEYPSLPGVEGAQLHPRVTPARGIHCKVASADSIKSECSKIHLITPEEQPVQEQKSQNGRPAGSIFI